MVTIHHWLFYFTLLGSLRVWRVPDGHDKKEALDESKIATNVDHETIEGSGRDSSRRAGLLSESNELGFWNVDQKAQSKKERYRLGWIWNFEETPSFW